jgi:hypothetical protein
MFFLVVNAREHIVQMKGRSPEYKIGRKNEYEG